MYEERGTVAPDYVKREMERCDDRFRQLLSEAHLDGNVFEQVRRKMADDPNNRWDHTRYWEVQNGNRVLAILREGRLRSSLAAMSVNVGAVSGIGLQQVRCENEPMYNGRGSKPLRPQPQSTNPALSEVNMSKLGTHDGGKPEKKDLPYDPPKGRRRRPGRARDLAALIMELREHKESDNGRDFKSELDHGPTERLDDLIKYTQDEKFRKLPVEDQDLIVQQASTLNAYKDIVTLRAEKAKVMTTPTDIANRALQVIGTRTTVTDAELADNSTNRAIRVSNVRCNSRAIDPQPRRT